MNLGIVVGTVISMAAWPAAGTPADAQEFVTTTLSDNLYLVRGDPDGNVMVLEHWSAY